MNYLRVPAWKSAQSLLEHRSNSFEDPSIIVTDTMCKFASKVEFKCGHERGGTVTRRCPISLSHGSRGPSRFVGDGCPDRQEVPLLGDICPGCKNLVARYPAPEELQEYLKNGRKYKILMEFWDKVRIEYENNGRHLWDDFDPAVEGENPKYRHWPLSW